MNWFVKNRSKNVKITTGSAGIENISLKLVAHLTQSWPIIPLVLIVLVLLLLKSTRANKSSNRKNRIERNP